MYLETQTSDLSKITIEIVDAPTQGLEDAVCHSDASEFLRVLNDRTNGAEECSGNLTMTPWDENADLLAARFLRVAAHQGYVVTVTDGR